MTYGTYCVVSIVCLILSFTAAILIGKSYELPKLKTQGTCSVNTLGVVPKVGDSCNVWDDKTQTCFKGHIVKKTIDGKEVIECEKKPIVPAIICLVITGLSLIAAITFGYLHYKNKSA